MQPLAIDPRILRTLLAPEIKVIPGRALMARVVLADGSGRGSLSIAGFLLEAELPPDVRTGQDLRLVVRDVSPDRVLLSLSEPHQPAPAPPPATPGAGGVDLPPPVPLPGGGSLQVAERDAGRASAPGSSRPHTLALRYNAPALGAVDLRFALDPSTMTLAVTVAPASLAAARAAADELRRTLADALGRSVSVTISPRREPVDVYA